MISQLIDRKPDERGVNILSEENIEVEKS